MRAFYIVLRWGLGINSKRSQFNEYRSVFGDFCGVEKLTVRPFQRSENHRKRINIRLVMDGFCQGVK